MGKPDELFRLAQNHAINIAKGGLLNHHRKLLPTNPERMVRRFGDGSGLKVVDTVVGRVGALIDELFPTNDEWITPGDAVVFKPFGAVHAGPMRKEKGC